MSDGLMIPLSAMDAGDSGVVVALRGGHGFRQRILDMGLRVGCEVEVTPGGAAGKDEGPVEVRTDETRLTLGHGMAGKIMVRARAGSYERLKIGDMVEGQAGRIVGYAGDDRAYRHKLLRMGLVKGAGFRLVRRAPMGDPIEIEVLGFRLTLRKDEAEALDVKILSE